MLGDVSEAMHRVEKPRMDAQHSVARAMGGATSLVALGGSW